MRRLTTLSLALLAAPILASAQNAPQGSFLVTDRPVSTNEIRVGLSCAQTGRAGAIGADYLRGARA